MHAHQSSMGLKIGVAKHLPPPVKTPIRNPALPLFPHLLAWADLQDTTHPIGSLTLSAYVS